MKLNTEMQVNQISDELWEIPTSEKEGMLVPARIYATPAILQSMDVGVFEQVTNVACLPGIRRYALCMPDGHWGYGFPIGGVAALDVRSGVISPGGVGYDINCGMRLIRTDLIREDVQPHLDRLMTELFRRVPAGVGASGFIRLDRLSFEDVMVHGARWCIEWGFGWHRDLDAIEEGGCITGADPSKVSDQAVSRGINQLGTWDQVTTISKYRWYPVIGYVTKKLRQLGGSPAKIRLLSWFTVGRVGSATRLPVIISRYLNERCGDMGFP